MTVTEALAELVEATRNNEPLRLFDAMAVLREIIGDKATADLAEAVRQEIWGDGEAMA